MKVVGKRVLRGSFGNANLGPKIPVLLEDGLINRGLRVTDVKVFPSALDPSAQLQFMLASRVLVPATNEWNAEDSAQIAWAMWGDPQGYWQCVDRRAIVVRDLVIHPFSESSPQDWNYVIEVDVLDLTDDEAIFAIIREEGQKVGNR